MKSLVDHHGFNENAELAKAMLFPTEEKVKEFLDIKYSSGYVFGIDNLTRSGVFRLSAIQYDFRPWLTKYLIQDIYGNLSSGYVPSKTALRRALSLPRSTKIFIFPTK